MRITVEFADKRLVIEDDQLEDFSLSMPSDVHTDVNGTRELGRTHVVLVAMLNEDARPLWEEING